MPTSSPGVARAGLVALALVTVACSSGSQDSAAPADAQLQVRVKDFKIQAPERISAGTVTFHVRNSGPDTHELILVRADGRALPLRPDNLTVDEDAVKPRTVGQVENDHPGTKRELTVKLPAGRYVLFCNMSGHYLGGMHIQLVVK